MLFYMNVQFATLHIESKKVTLTADKQSHKWGIYVIKRSQLQEAMNTADFRIPRILFIF